MPALRRGETTIEYRSAWQRSPALAPCARWDALGNVFLGPRAVPTRSPSFPTISRDRDGPTERGRSRAPITAADGWHSYADDQLALLDELEVERCHLHGGCIGGAFALSLIARAPERVSSAVLQQPIGYSGSNREVFYELFDGWIAELKQTRADIAEQACRLSRSHGTTGTSWSVSAVNRSPSARCRCSSCAGTMLSPQLDLRRNRALGAARRARARLGKRAMICHAP